MKKIPTLFERVYENHKVVDVLPKVTVGMEWVLEGEGITTVKLMVHAVQLSMENFTSVMMKRTEILFQKVLLNPKTNQTQ